MLAVIMAIENEDDRLFVETVFNRYAKKLYLVAYNILGNRADAEDCVQDTFVKIIDKAGSLQKRAKGRQSHKAPCYRVQKHRA